VVFPELILNVVPVISPNFIQPANDVTAVNEA